MGSGPLDRITSADARKGTPLSAAPDSSLILSSKPFTWPGIIVEWHPHRFVLRQRIQKSLQLIKEGKLSLSQVAVEAGFYDQAHFTRAFRATVGTTPAAYARRI